jgi:DNA topoisomerase VI subunit A
MVQYRGLMQNLKRETFEISRELEFFSEKELQMQIGHGRRLWPVALLKELIDNSLDACEGAGVAPQIGIEIGEDYFGVRDNGPGLPAETLTRSLDYLKRVSDKAFYVSPTRGQLGNALKTVWAAPFVAHGERGIVEVSSLGLHHTVEVSLDRISQAPAISHTVEEDGLVRNGTFFKIHWPELACSETPSNDDDSYETPNFRESARELIESYSAFNPRATFHFDDVPFEATGPVWRKWAPSDPTSAHWYTPETMRDLIAAYIGQEREGARARTIREFVSEFRGLAGTAKQKQITANIDGVYLHDLITEGDLDLSRIESLLVAMREHSQPPKPPALGIIGEPHFKTWMMRAGVAHDSFRYARRLCADGLPHVLELAFGVREEGELRIVTGLNWAPTLSLPMEAISRLLGSMRIDRQDPVTVAIHIARPRFEFVDRGKTRMQAPAELEADLESAIKTVAKEWKRAKRNADRNDRIRESAYARMLHRPERVTIRSAAFDVMERAYLKASGNGTLPAEARQIYYAARGPILEATGADALDSQYFTQTLLKDYMEVFSPAWDVNFDDRGHITEPHTGTVVGLGGLAVRDYIGEFTNGDFPEMPGQEPAHRISTTGPGFRYGAVLFIEKEGFDPLLKAAGIAERFDIAICSTKGMPVSALCDLLATLKEHGIKVFVAHDFDKSGFSILGTLRRGTRGSKGTGDVIDLGLRLADIEGLERERVTYKANPRNNLIENGATAEEIAILHPCRYEIEGERVELNAMTSPQFIAWIEGKLTEHGVKKLIPEREAIQAAYRRAVFLQRMQAEMARQREQIAAQGITLPARLESAVRAELKRRPELAWDEAVWAVAERGTN